MFFQQDTVTSKGARVCFSDPGHLFDVITITGRYCAVDLHTQRSCTVYFNTPSQTITSRLAVQGGADGKPAMLLAADL
jgi:hypothetical protein